MTLTEWMEGSHQIDGDRESFRITDDSSADWAGRKLKAARDRIAANNALADDEIHRVEAWLVDVNSTLTADAHYFEWLLTQYALEVRAADPKRKSIKLPTVTMSTREPRATVTITDEDELKAWAKAHRPELIRITETTDKPALNKLRDGDTVVTPDGEIIPGVEVVKADIPTVTVTT